jgi:uncharacterized protein
MPGTARGARLVICHRPTVRPRATVVYVHPFAEEMNKSRRMVALQARALASAGFMVCLIDLRGCGDSSGEMGDVAWEDWVRDVVDLSTWALERADAPLLLWGLRAGCLIATEAARRLDAALGLIFWQPASAGRTVLQQFLRLKLAAEMQSPGAKGVVDALRARLAGGETVEVAGYTLPPALAAGLENTRLDPMQRTLPVAWVEVASQPDTPLQPASEAVVARWRAAGHPVQTVVVAGSPFWNSVEIAEAPALLPVTVAAAEGLLS